MSMDYVSFEDSQTMHRGYVNQLVRWGQLLDNGGSLQPLLDADPWERRGEGVKRVVRGGTNCWRGLGSSSITILYLDNLFHD